MVNLWQTQRPHRISLGQRTAFPAHLFRPNGALNCFRTRPVRRAMAKWIAKAALQRTISMLPRSHSLNYLLQKHITKSLDPGPVWFKRRLRECRWHLENYFNTIARKDAHLLELGTGWYPTVPLSFWLCGVSNIVTIDIQPVLRREFFRATCESFIASGESGELTQALPWVKEDRVSLLRRVADREAPPAQLLAELGIKAVVKDARETGLESGSIDFFWSNGVLYEIPEGILTSIFAEFSRVASPTAVMSHYVLMKDPYADFDLSITPFNFLKYSDWTWNLLFNSLSKVTTGFAYRTIGVFMSLPGLG